MSREIRQPSRAGYRGCAADLPGLAGGELEQAARRAARLALLGRGRVAADQAPRPIDASLRLATSRLGDVDPRARALEPRRDDREPQQAPRSLSFAATTG